MVDALWLAALAVMPFSLAAPQSSDVRGLVRDSMSREPIAGAVIAMLDAAGTPFSHAISGADGRYRLARPVTATSLRVRRIGFRPRVIELSRDDESGPLDIVMLRVPQLLPAQIVRSAALCPDSRKSGDAHALWEQARDGLYATVVAREAMPAHARVLTFTRSRDPDNDLVVQYRHEVRVGLITRSFRSAAPPALYADSGYVNVDATGRTYHAPDADVLLDESFAATHCFRIVSGGASRPGQLGLAFAPARTRRSVADIEGVLWLDAARPALRALEFRYTGLDRTSTSAGAGGSVEFATMSNGVALITRWVLRMPVLTERFAGALRAPSPVSRGRRTRPRAPTLTVAEIREGGGMVVSARWQDGLLWQQPVGGLNGRVVQRDTRRPIANALVTLAGAADTVTADSAGNFEVAPVVPGRYDIIAVDTSLAAYVSERRMRRAVEILPIGTAAVALELPSPEEIVARLCAETRTRADSRAILGRVRHESDASERADLEVHVAWNDHFGASAGASGATVAVASAERTITPDSSGRFHVCGVVRERPITLTVRRQAELLLDTVVYVYDSSFKPVDLVTREAPSFIGSVRRDSIGPGIAGAQIIFPQLQRVGVTDARGRFRLDGLPEGRHAVTVRALGTAPQEDTVILIRGQSTSRDYVLARLTELEPVEATAAATSLLTPALRAFEDRRRLGFGRFLGPEVLRAHDASGTLGTLIAKSFPGIRVVPTGSGAFLASSRSASGPTGRAFEGTAGRNCWVTVYLDGNVLYDGSVGSMRPPDIDRMWSRDFSAIEFYNAASTPPEFRRTSSGCGTLLLWSRQDE